MERYSRNMYVQIEAGVSGAEKRILNGIFAVLYGEAVGGLLSRKRTGVPGPVRPALTRSR